MLTFHPAARRTKLGDYLPMVMVRNAKGQCVGSRSSDTHTFSTEASAYLFAHMAALRVTMSPAFLMTTKLKGC